MKPVIDLGRYLWRFFVGDAFQLIGLMVTFAIVGLLVRPLGAWAGGVAMVLVMAVVWLDAFRRHAAGQKW